MGVNKVILIIFLCTILQTVRLNAADVSKRDEEPCDTCPRNGKCVPKISCPARLRKGTKNPECHLKNGKIGVCCYTGRKHADFKLRQRTKNNDSKKKAHNASKTKWKKYGEKIKKVREYSNDTVVCPNTPDYGHQMTFPAPDKSTDKLGEGALLNLFAAEDLKKRQAFTDDELALEYGEIYEGPYCPPQPICPPPGPFRSVNGECNNPAHPTWGAANTGYERLLSPAYDDGIWSMRKSKSGAPLTSPRKISSIMVMDGDYPNAKLNLVASQLSQFIAHDVSAAAIHNLGNGSFISCCTRDGDFLPPEQLHFACAPIAVDPEDEFFSHFKKVCLNFVRAQLAPSPDCSCGYAKQMNGATHLPDLSQIYGKSEEKQKTLRAEDGYMKTFDDYGRQFPPLTDRPECLTAKDQGPCFDSGDGHANQIISLTCVHTVFTREHNSIVEQLRYLNPKCDAEAIFNTAKKIIMAIYQHIIYNEWLPLIIGPELMETFELYSCEGYSSGYDPEINPSVLTEFAGAAMRFGHSTFPGQIEVTCPRYKLFETIAIPEVMSQPSRLRQRPYYDCLLHSMMKQPMQNTDPFLTFGFTRYLFRGGNAFGLDLASLNIQRGRDFGIRPYNDYRRLCGLKPYEDFGEFSNTTRDRLSAVYSCPDDVDLWIGGLLEKPVDGGVVGPTFACIFAEQFSRFKKGDRYNYVYGPDVNPGAFTLIELAEIKKATMFRLLCNNLDYIEISAVSPNPFIRSDFPGNAPIECNETTIGLIDLSKFKVC